MNKYTIIIIAVFLVSVFGSLTYIAWYGKEKESLAILTTEIINTNERIIQAYQTNDVKALDGLFALGYMHNNPLGMSLDRETFLNDIRSGVLRFEYYRNPEFNIQFYGNNDICVATGVIEAKAVRDNRVIEGGFRFTRIFVKQGGHWREELFQATQISIPSVNVDVIAGD